MEGQARARRPAGREAAPCTEGRGVLGLKYHNGGAPTAPHAQGETRLSTEVVVVTLFTLWSAKSKAGPVSTLCRVQQ